MQSDIFNLLVGRKIGRGIHRSVHRLRFSPELVVKVAHSESGRRANLKEYLIWDIAECSRHARWLAPVRACSTDGSFLVMDYAHPASRKDFPRRVPAFLSDLQYDNFGILDGRLVCVDYANAELELARGEEEARWWDAAESMVE